ncbi:MAG: carboxypeptidase-like regulatory domain-containing protein [Flavobacteriales bacterium]|nr:carboxypeptidase-like regulatory domain-containing protein [Flavobacteriales bacterium]
MSKLKANLLAVCFLLSIGSILGQGTIRGTITDGDTGESLIGASVVVKGTTIGSVANVQGEFELEVDQNPPILLVVKFLGYSPKEVTVNFGESRL